jgi:hypothetical protein
MQSEATGLALNKTAIPLRWSCASIGREIECAPGALHAACMEAVEGMRSLAKGGLEVGGVLYGRHEGGLVQILAARPIQCEHRFGPSFVLSEQDESFLAQMLSGFRTDRALASLEPLGCYLSHPRHGAVLTDRDIDLYRRYFGQTIQLALILMPRSLGSVHVNVIGRNTEGAHVACHEFEYSLLNHPRSEIVHTKLPARVPRSNPVPKLDVEIVPIAPPPTLVPVIISAPRAPIRIPNQTTKPFPRHRLIFALLILMVCAPRPNVPIAPVPLSFREGNPGLMIHWDPSDSVVREAARGLMDIQDGEQEPVRLSLAPDVLQRGSLPYARTSDIVRVSFTLVGKKLSAVEHTIYIAPGRRLKSPSEVKAPESANKNSLPPPTRRNPEIAAIPVPSDVKEAHAQNDAPRSFRPPAARTIRTSNLNSVPALIPEPPPLRESAMVANPTVPSLPALSIPAPAPVPVAHPPASGRLIWTGQLSKRAVMSLTSHGASIGYINGWIPPKTPVHIEVRPGELIEGGIVVYTKDPNSRSEPPSAGNGWNTVIYKQDNARASDLEVVEAPGSANDWSQLVLRNGDRRISLIILDWRSTK